MNTDLQKASIGKRIIAAIFDGILLSIIAVAVATILSSVLGYDGYMERLDSSYQSYESEYGITLDITQEEYNALDDGQRQNYDAASKAISEDKDVIYVYNMLINLSLIITVFGVLFGVLVVEFFVPIFLKNGQTLGKKIFGIGVMHNEGIKVSNLQLFVRAVLGKFALELMIPLSIVIMIFFNTIGITGLAVMLIYAVVQIICFVTSHTYGLLHDVLAGTVAVDFASQRIFDNREQLIEYKKARHAEKVSREL